jgi:hypothetical protein
MAPKEAAFQFLLQKLKILGESANVPKDYLWAEKMI